MQQAYYIMFYAVLNLPIYRYHTVVQRGVVYCGCDLWVWSVSVEFHGASLTFSKLILSLQVLCSNQLHLDQCIGLGTWSTAESPAGNSFGQLTAQSQDRKVTPHNMRIMLTL